jgi:hypothetical protein
MALSSRNSSFAFFSFLSSACLSFFLSLSFTNGDEKSEWIGGEIGKSYCECKCKEDEGLMKEMARRRILTNFFQLLLLVNLEFK